MRTERWYWLLVFCLLSLSVHLGMLWKSHTFYTSPPAPTVTEMEVALLPLPQPTPVPKKQEPQPKPKLKPEPKVPPKVVQRAAPSPRQTGVKLAATPERRRPVKPLVPTKDEKPEVVKTSAPAVKIDTGGMQSIKDEKPLPLGLPSRNSEAPRMARATTTNPLQGGGGSPSPNSIPGGKGGVLTPEAPPDDIQYSGGGAGGEKLPKAEPRIGGGGGRSILSVDNPLAKDAIPEEKPGVGVGLEGGQGSGAKGGIGTARGQGIGTRLDGKSALATLRAKPGAGVGLGQGNGIGTRPPSGGKGTGAETPGIGGDGLGYGRGRGVGVGVGDGGNREHANGSGGDNRFGLSRGIPFGDIGGLLRGGNPKGGGGVSGNGPGGLGRGAVFGTRVAKGGKGSVHIVYLLDSSGSMREGNKIGKAKEALKRALSELKPVDSFNIIHFNRGVYPFMNVLLAATPENIAQANEFVDAIRIKPDTNMSGGLEAAFALKGITHIFLLSDGEPHTGIEDPDKLRAMVKDLNTTHIHLITFALGLGEQFRGMALLKALAEENSGQFSYVDLSH